MPKQERPAFEKCIDQINREIAKRKPKWNLTALSWIDFDDVAQILRIHIFKKWHLYDPSKPLAPWINRIISNQIKNLIRNNYGNYARPCLRCVAAEGDNLCGIYGKQDSSCPLYAEWEKNKKSAHDIKIPVSLENHAKEVHDMSGNYFDVDSAVIELNKKAKEFLRPIEWKVYRLLYIENLTEEQAAKQMGYKTSEKNRVPGYKQIKNIQKSIIKKIKKKLENDEIDIY